MMNNLFDTEYQLPVLQKVTRQDLIEICREKINECRKGTAFKPIPKGNDFDLKFRTRQMTNAQLGAFVADCDKAPNFSKHFYIHTSPKYFKKND